MNNKVHVKKNDHVLVTNGKSRGMKGKVIEVSPREGKIIIEGVNMVTKHAKPRKQGDPGGILKAEGALYASKVQLICPECGRPTRVGRTFNEKGEKLRVCKKSDCKAVFE